MDQQSPRADNNTSLRASSRRSEIVSAAVEVFAARGYVGASVREIAERVGISKGNLTYHFAVKDDLLFEIAADLHDSFLQLAQTWTGHLDETPCDALREAFRRHVLLVSNRLNQTRVSYEAFRYLSKTRRAIIIEKRDRYEAAMRELIAACRPEPDASAARRNIIQTRIVLGMLNWPYQWYSPRGSVNASELANLVADMAFRALDP